MASGCMMWLADRPPGEDPRGILEVERPKGTLQALNDATPLALLTGKRRWKKRSYAPY